MKISAITLMIASMVFALTTFTPAHAENIVVVNVSGTFGQESDLFGNLPVEDFPFPQLYGGSFEGSFSYDADAIPDGFSIDYQSVNVEILANDGTLLHTIDSGPNTFKAFDGFAIAAMGESFGGDAVESPEDLRLWYDGPFVSGVTPSASVMATATPNPGNSFIEIDGTEDFTYWDLPVSSFSSIVDQYDEKQSCEALENAESNGNGNQKGMPKAKENNGCP